MEIVAPRLLEIRRFNRAAESYLSVDKVKEAVDAFIAGEEWSKAKKVARELEPRLEAYVDEKYKQAMKSAGKADKVMEVDVLGALDMLAQQVSDLSVKKSGST